MTQTGGTVAALRLVLGEGGNASSRATYNLNGGVLEVLEDANIGKGPGIGDPLANSYGTINISGGIAIFGDVYFGNDATDIIHLSGTGLLRVQQSNYPMSDAAADISAGKIIGTELFLSQVEIDNLLYTQISTFITAPSTTSKVWRSGAWTNASVPDPNAGLLTWFALLIGVAQGRSFGFCSRSLHIQLRR
jgi:hypothetical protein